MNGEVCCILGVCCPPNSNRQSSALAGEMVKDGVCGEVKEAKAIAEWLFEHFDLGPKGTVTPLLQAGAKLQRDVKV